MIVKIFFIFHLITDFECNMFFLLKVKEGRIMRNVM